jgi:hypothetical protein
MLYHYELFHIKSTNINWLNKTITITEGKNIIYTQFIHYDHNSKSFEINDKYLNYPNILKNWDKHKADCFKLWCLDTSILKKEKDYLVIPFYKSDTTLYIAIILLISDILKLPSCTIYCILINISNNDNILKLYKNILNVTNQLKNNSIFISDNKKIRLDYIINNIKNYMPLLSVNIQKINRISCQRLFSKSSKSRTLATSLPAILSFSS